MQYTQLSRRSASNKIDWEKQYLTFIPIEDAVFNWAERAVSGHLEYSVNGGQTWMTIANGESTPTITAGSKVIWRGNLEPQVSNATKVRGIGTFSASGNYNAYGNTMSLLFYDNYYNSQLNSTKHKYVFYRLFESDTHLLSAPLLTSTTLANDCYRNMFFGCISLVTAPKVLPATTLANNCYSNMFDGCTSLISVPELPATTLANNCYYNMFHSCTSLISVPELPATTLANNCYYNMFNNCASLITAPELPATTLANNCYTGMFNSCKSLVTAPELPATTLATSCYGYMFNSCTKLNYIKCLATNISASSCTTSWVTNVASTGIFVKAAEMEDWLVGDDGLPSGWTVVDDNS